MMGPHIQRKSPSYFESVDYDLIETGGHDVVIDNSDYAYIFEQVYDDDYENWQEYPPLFFQLNGEDRHQVVMPKPEAAVPADCIAVPEKMASDMGLEVPSVGFHLFIASKGMARILKQGFNV